MEVIGNPFRLRAVAARSSRWLGAFEGVALQQLCQFHEFGGHTRINS